MRAEPPECRAKLMAQAEFQCLQCGRKVDEYESAWFGGRRICTECSTELHLKGDTPGASGSWKAGKARYSRMDASTASSASCF